RFGADRSLDAAVHIQATGEVQAALDVRVAADQRVDRTIRRPLALPVATEHVQFVPWVNACCHGRLRCTVSPFRPRNSTWMVCGRKPSGRIIRPSTRWK